MFFIDGESCLSWITFGINIIVIEFGIAEDRLQFLVCNNFYKKHSDNWLRSDGMAGYFMA